MKIDVIVEKVIRCLRGTHALYFFIVHPDALKQD